VGKYICPKYYAMVLNVFDDIFKKELDEMSDL
jgi:hypothetical protein